MANQNEINNSDRKNLSALYVIEELGGTLADAIKQAEAAMDEEIVEKVKKKYKKNKSE